MSAMRERELLVRRRNRTGEADSIYLIFVTICVSARKTNTDNTVGSETSENE